MVFRFYPHRHRRLRAFVKYQLPELKAVTGDTHIEVLNPNGTVYVAGQWRMVLKQLDARGLLGRGRVQGLAGVVTVPADATYAMKKGRLIRTPKAAQARVEPMAAAARKVIARRCVAQTTEKGPNGRRVKKYVRVIPLTIEMPAASNRAGEVDPGRHCFILPKGWDPVGKKWRTIDRRRLLYAQAEAQAAANLALGFSLRDQGILCLPQGKSITAFGYTARPQASTTLKAAGVAGGQAGPQKAKAAAQSRAAQIPKQVVPWRQALRNLKGTVDAALTRAVSNLLVALDEAAQERLAAGAIKDAFKYHRRAGHPRLHEGSVYATAAQLATPHVKQDVFDRQWQKLTADPGALGVKEARLQVTGQRVWVGLSQEAAEHQAGKALYKARRAGVKGIDRRDVIGALVGQGPLTPQERTDVVELCGKGGLRWASSYAPGTLARAAEVYRRAGRNVHVVGSPALAKQLGVGAAFSAAGFVDSATRTPHLRAIWNGLREAGPFGDWLGAAERIRATPPRVHVKRGDMVVLAPKGLEDARAVAAVARFARRAGAKVVMDGPGAEPYRGLTATVARRAGRGIHP